MVFNSPFGLSKGSSIKDVRKRGDGGLTYLVRFIQDKGGRGSNIGKNLRTSFMDGPINKLCGGNICMRKENWPFFSVFFIARLAFFASKMLNCR